MQTFKLLLILLGLALSAGAQSNELDIAPFAKRCCREDRLSLQTAFDYTEAGHAGKDAERAADGRFIYGLQWAEERDVREVRVQFEPGSQPVQAAVQYWYRYWPYPPPEMPHIEDPADDPWQGKWLTAATLVNCAEKECGYRFLPLEAYENPRASNLSGVDYRRTLKLRLVFGSKPAIAQVQVFSGSRQKPVEVRIELGAGETAPYEWRGSARVYNGVLKEVRLWNGSPGDHAEVARFEVRATGEPKGLLLTLTATEPSLPGSKDVTVVTMDAGDRTFSFAISDVEKGPVYVPDFHAYITLATDIGSFSPSIVSRGAKIRERIPEEPEQSYERASKEIPPLDPVLREGGRLYLPLAADSSWQKFAFEWGGNVLVSKQGTKAMGAELKRLEWAGDEIRWRIGTGASPNFRPEWKDSKLSVLDGYLPVATARWRDAGVEYSEEAFATLLSGPLSPDDPARREQTPAVLLVKLTARRQAPEARDWHFWLAIDPQEELHFENEKLVDATSGLLLRAGVHLPSGVAASVSDLPGGEISLHGLHAVIPFGAESESAVIMKLPLIPRLSAEQQKQLAQLDYDNERARAIAYWRNVTAHSLPFEIPEKRFMSFAQANLVHILIGAAKDPKSGLYINPEASYVYGEFANGTAYHAARLDAYGEHSLAGKYLDTLVKLQGSRRLDGTYPGDQRWVYHGARVDADYDYTMGDYNLDHGTTLWGLAEHYFYTRDQAWLRQTTPSMEKAADWIVEQRKLTEVLDENGGKIPEYGLLPAGHLEDNDDWWHWFAINAVAVQGMTRMAQALADTGAPEATQYAEQAAAYKRDLRDAVLQASRLAPVVRLRDNTYVPFVPVRPYERLRIFGPQLAGYYSRYPEKVTTMFRLSATREVFCSPVMLLDTDVFGVDERLAEWILDDWEDNRTLSTSLGLNVHGWVDDEYWFSRGGMVWEANYQNPSLTYLRRNEVPAAIRTLYNDFVSCLYPDVNAFTEEYREWRHASGPFYKSSDEARFLYHLRYALVREDGESLWLGAGAPRRWLSPGEKIEVRAAPTYFGPVSYGIEASETGITAHVELPTRNEFQAAWLVLRLPEGKQVRTVEIDGKPWKQFDPKTERIGLPLKPGRLKVAVQF